jgi:hypothetical protein
MITLQPLANHLWQSTLCAAVAGLLTLTCGRGQSFRTPYCAVSDPPVRPDVCNRTGQPALRRTRSSPFGFGGGPPQIRQLDSGHSLCRVGDRFHGPCFLLVAALAKSSRDTAHFIASTSSHQYRSEDLASICRTRCLRHLSASRAVT